MFSTLTTPANLRRRRALVGSWLVHAGLWLVMALFPLLLRNALLEEANIIGLDSSSVIDHVLRDQIDSLSRFFSYAMVLCVALSGMGLLWAWHLLNQKRWAWRWAIAWLGFEYLSLCWVIWLATSTPDWQDSQPTNLLGGDRPWFIGFVLIHMLLMGVMPFVHLWARRAYELRPGEHSDAQRLKWWLAEQSERLMRRLFRRPEPEQPLLDQPPLPAIPQDIERRQMWPSAPLPPADEAVPPLRGEFPPPDDSYLRS